LTDDWEKEDEEHDNIRAALAWAQDRGEIEVALQFAASAGLFYWLSRGQLTEGRRWLDGVLARAEGADPRRRARALVAAARVAGRQGDYERCDALAAEAQAVLERVGDRPALASALMSRAIAAESRGDREAGGRYYDSAEAIFRELGYTEALDAILSNRAYADIFVGDFESAERRQREIADSATGHSRLYAVANLGLVLAFPGRLDEAEACYAEVLQIVVATQTTTELILYGFEGLAAAAGSRAEDQRAAQLWGVSSGIAEATGYALAPAEQRLRDELVPEVRTRLGESDFDRAWQTGRQLALDEAMG